MNLRPAWLSLGSIVALGSGIFLADRFSIPLLAIGIFIAVLLVLTMLSRRRLTLFLGCCFLLCMSIGTLRLAWEAQQLAALPQYLAGAKLIVEGTVAEKRGTYQTEKGQTGRYLLTVERWAYADTKAFQPGRGRIYILMPEDKAGYERGEKLRLSGQSSPLRYYQNRGLYDQQHRNKEKEVFLRLFVEKAADVQRLAPPGRLAQFLQDLQKRLTSRFVPVLGQDQGHILMSLLFGGHYDELPPQILEDFSTTGLIHILSVSGSHVALLLAAIQLAGCSFGLRRRGIFLLSLIFLLIYGALSEFTAPVVRASLMGAISAGSLSLRRDYTAAHALALAMAAMLLYSPYLFFDLSFRLSCGASAGIILLQAPLQQLFRGDDMNGRAEVWAGIQLMSMPLRWLGRHVPQLFIDGITVCLAAQLLVLPLLLQAFFSLPLYTLLANLLVAPVLDLLLVLGLAASLLTLVWIQAADFILWVIRPLLALALQGNAFLAALPHSRLWLGAPTAFFSVAWYLGLGALLLKRQRYFFLPLAALCLAFSFFQSGKPGPMLYILDAGNDQVTCIKYDDRTADLWYNRSEFASPQQAAFVVTPALRQEGIFRLRRLVLTGKDTAQTEAILRKNFAAVLVTAADKIEGEGLPFTGFAQVPPRFPSQGLLEIRSLAHWDGQRFPLEAAATVVYPRRKGEEAFTEWCETAAFYGRPCFSPARDGELIFSYEKGTWQRRLWKTS